MGVVGWARPACVRTPVLSILSGERLRGGRAVFSFLVIENFVAIENVDSKLPVILQLVSPNLCIPSVS